MILNDKAMFDSFTYVKSNGETETIDLTISQAKVKVDEIGIHYCPFHSVSNDPIWVLIPWNRVVEVFYRRVDLVRG